MVDGGCVLCGAHSYSLVQPVDTHQAHAGRWLALCARGRTWGGTAIDMPEGYPKCEIVDNKLTQTHIYEHPWEVVVESHEMRYPQHPDLPMMQSSTVTRRDRSDLDSGREKWWRTNVVKNPAVPRLLSYAFGGDTMEFEELYELDHYERVMVETGRNVSFRDGRWGVKLDEVVEYRAHPDRPSWTLFKLEASLSLPPLPGGMESTAEAMFR
jgi:hypothetical protein